MYERGRKKFGIGGCMCLCGKKKCWLLFAYTYIHIYTHALLYGKKMLLVPYVGKKKRPFRGNGKFFKKRFFQISGSFFLFFFFFVFIHIIVVVVVIGIISIIVVVYVCVIIFMYCYYYCYCIYKQFLCVLEYH